MNVHGCEENRSAHDDAQPCAEACSNDRVDATTQHSVTVDVGSTCAEPIDAKREDDTGWSERSGAQSQSVATCPTGAAAYPHGGNADRARSAAQRHDTCVDVDGSAPVPDDV